MLKINKVGVIGLGYIGLPTAVTLANHGIAVHGVDVHESAVDMIARGRPHIHEPGLDAVLETCVKSGALRVSSTPQPCDAFVLAVPTPFEHDHIPDLSYVQAATASIAPVLVAGNLVILESTSPIGTTERVARQLASLRPDLTFPTVEGASHQVHVAHCPERVLPGQILHELVHNARVIGGICPCCTRAAIDLYRRFVEGDCVETNARTAEMVKLSENTFRDVNIAFANELGLIADRLGVDVTEVIRLANLHPRVDILRPGTGVGGHCIAVDPWFVIHSAPAESKLIRTARLINDAKPKIVADKVVAAHGALAQPRVVGCLGLTYKPDVGDIRESPSIAVIEHLLKAGVTPILVHDPFVSELPREICKPGVKLTSLESVLIQANILVLLTGHREYRSLNAGVRAGKTVIDPSGTWKTS
jgi:UDP-N-acetyl-D-mannosaminuronic acid dehydrogenase